MCGIAGFVQRRRAPRLLRDMVASLAHRGPDGSGEVVQTQNGWQVHIGHRRLSILDLDGGAQPMASADRRSLLSYNGEIYNFAELARGLRQRGGRLRGSGDTEVLLELLVRDGNKALPRLDGMFALALWSRDRGELLLARDRMGIKPLYLAPLPDGGLVFASELTTLLLHPAIERCLDRQALVDYLVYDHAPAPRSMVAGVHKLAPAHTVCWHNGQLSEPQRFWRPPQPERSQPPPRLESLAALLQNAVDAQRVSDVPIGVLLSGGLDSSLIALLAARQHKGVLQSFSIGFEQAEFDESAAAQQVAAHIGTRHHCLRLGDAQALDAVDRALHMLDEPLADPSIVPSLCLAELAAREVKVVLSGDGADELFAGYPTYLAQRAASLYGALPARLRRGLSALADLLPQDEAYLSLAFAARRFTQRFANDAALRQRRFMASLCTQEIHALAPTLARFSPSPVNLDLHSRESVEVALRHDLLCYLPGSVLCKVDRASMAHGLEVRPAFLSNALIEHALRMPWQHKIRGSQGKVPLRNILRGQLPDAIVKRRKHGFGIPLARWTRGPLRPRVEAMLRASPIFEVGGLDPTALRRRAQAHFDRRSDFSRPLWALLVLDHWMRRCELRI